MELLIEGNQLFQIGRLRDERTEIVAAVLLRNVIDAAVLGNQIRQVAFDSPTVFGRGGVIAAGAVTLRVASNAILDVGGDEYAGVGVGVLVGGVIQRVDVLDNTIRRRQGDVEGGSAWSAISIFAPVGQVEGGGLEFDALGRASSAVYAADGQAERAYVVQPNAGKVVVVAGDRGSVGVRGNVADGTGPGAAVIVMSGACVLGENRVTHDGAREGFAAVQVRARSGAVTSNHVVTRRGHGSIEIVAGPCTVVGNVTSTPIELNGAVLPPPWDVLNV